jgi:RNA polymerase sigma-70 factor (ECF subfamily)
VASLKDSADLQVRDQQWEALIASVASGDQVALARLYDVSSRLVYGLVLRIVGNAASAEEVLLDVYTQVWRQAARYDSKRGSVLAWLMTIARSRAIDRLRSCRQEGQCESPLDLASAEQSELASPEENSLLSERQRLVRSAIAALSPEQREVIELAYYSGLSHSEIAAKLGQPLGTVKTRTRLAMIKLRQMLAPIIEGKL